MSYIFISHDLAVVKYMADQVLVMNEGEVVGSPVRTICGIRGIPRDPASSIPQAGAARPATSLRMSEVLLRARNLNKSCTGRRAVRAVDGVDLEIRRGEPSRSSAMGSGKTMTALSLVRLLPETGRIVSGVVELSGVDLLACPRRRCAPYAAGASR